MIDGDWEAESHSALMQILTPSKISGNNKSTRISESNLNFERALSWVDLALSYEGIKEIKDSAHHEEILKWLDELGAWWRDDEKPWCGVFVAYCLHKNARGIPEHWYRAKSYADYGTKLNAPAFGCIGVMSRKGGGHVCIIIGIIDDGKRLVVIGGNQNDSVSIASYPIERFTAFVWASHADGERSFPLEHRYYLPVYERGKYDQPVSEA